MEVKLRSHTLDGRTIELAGSFGSVKITATENSHEKVTPQTLQLTDEEAKHLLLMLQKYLY